MLKTKSARSSSTCIYRKTTQTPHYSHHASHSLLARMIPSSQPPPSAANPPPSGFEIPLRF